jgi:dipeptidyl aminopeptidase/acylaminoacyl peptidase
MRTRAAATFTLTGGVLAALAIGHAGSSGAPAGGAPLRLVAERLEIGNPPVRRLVALKDDGSAERAIEWTLQPGTGVLALAAPRGSSRLLAAITVSPANSRATTIVSFRLDGSDRHRVATAGSGAIAVSSGGRLIAYVRSPNMSRVRAQIWVMTGDGTHRRLLVPAAPDRLDFPGSWSPDGESLVFTRCPLPGGHGEHDWEDHCAVYVIGADGDGLRKLADSALLPDCRRMGGRSCS